MATVHITLCDVRNASYGSGAMPVPQSVPAAVDTMTSTGVSTQSGLTAELSAATGFRSRFWTVVADGPVFVAFGADPTAGADAGWYLPAGVPMSWSVTGDNEKIAVKDA